MFVITHVLKFSNSANILLRILENVKSLICQAIDIYISRMNKTATYGYGYKESKVRVTYLFHLFQIPPACCFSPRVPFYPRDTSTPLPRPILRPPRQPQRTHSSVPCRTMDVITRVTSPIARSREILPAHTQSTVPPAPWVTIRQCTHPLLPREPRERARFTTTGLLFGHPQPTNPNPRS